MFCPQSLLYKKVHEAQFRSHLANEMMKYHMKVKLKICPSSLTDVCRICSLSTTQSVCVSGVRGGGVQATGDRDRNSQRDPPLLRRVHVHTALAAWWHHAHGN